MSKTVVREVKMDLQRIFLTPPNTQKEKGTFFVLQIMIFVMFFAPICFSEIHPFKAVLLAFLPAFSLSWGWTVLMRSLFRKSDFCTNNVPTGFKTST